MKALLITITLFSVLSFSEIQSPIENEISKSEFVVGSSFTLINDTKLKVSIYTGTGFVSLNKGLKTSIGCNIDKEVRWAKSGKKGAVIFKIDSKHCGKSIKLSEFIN